MEKKAGGQPSYTNEEKAQLYKELNDCKKELSKLKVEKAQSEANLQTRVKILNEVVDNLTKQIEIVSTERDDARYEVQRRKACKNQKIKEYDRMKQQVCLIFTILWINYYNLHTFSFTIQQKAM